MTQAKDKSLKESAVDIKGKKYVPVSARIVYFNEIYENGRIVAELLSPIESKHIMMKATVTPDLKNADRYFVGHSQAVVGEGYINKTSALENCETSAIGRALALMGIGVIESVASVDEINKAEGQVQAQTPRQNNPSVPHGLAVKECVSCGQEFKTKYANATTCYPCFQASKNPAPQAPLPNVSLDDDQIDVNSIPF